MSERGRLIVLSGPSGVGKGTVLARYLAGRERIKVSVSATTRAPRAGETDGVHYYYLTREQFEEKISSGGMLEWAQYNNQYYGTPRAPVEEALREGVDVMLEIEVQGGLQVKRAFPDAAMIFILPPSFQVLRQRLVGRGTEDGQSVEKRLRAAVEELRRAQEYDFLLVNDRIEDTVRELEAAVEAAHTITRRQQSLLTEVLQDAQTDSVTD